MKGLRGICIAELFALENIRIRNIARRCRRAYLSRSGPAQRPADLRVQEREGERERESEGEREAAATAQTVVAGEEGGRPGPARRPGRRPTLGEGGVRVGRLHVRFVSGEVRRFPIDPRHPDA